MTGIQQLEQPRGTREYIPRHAWAEPTEAPIAQAPPAQTTETPSLADVLLYEAPADEAVDADEPTRPLLPYQLVETTSDYVTIVPERRHRWRTRRTA